MLELVGDKRAINGNAIHRAAKLGPIGPIIAEGAELGDAHGTERQRDEEQDHLLVADHVADIDFVSRACGEFEGWCVGTDGYGHGGVLKVRSFQRLVLRPRRPAIHPQSPRSLTPGGPAAGSPGTDPPAENTKHRQSLNYSLTCQV